MPDLKQMTDEKLKENYDVLDWSVDREEMIKIEDEILRRMRGGKHD